MIPAIKKRALHRTKIIEGQIRGLQKMIDSEEYCIDILTQSLAIQKSLGSLSKLLVENHLRTHVAHDLHSGDAETKDRAIAELVNLFELSNNRGSAK